MHVCYVSKFWHKVQFVRAISMKPFWCLAGRVKEFSWLTPRWAPSLVQWKLEARTCLSFPPGALSSCGFTTGTTAVQQLVCTQSLTSPSQGGAPGWASRLSLTPAPALWPCWGITAPCLTVIITSGPDPEPCNAVGKGTALIWLAVTVGSRLTFLCRTARPCCALMQFWYTVLAKRNNFGV